MESMSNTIRNDKDLKKKSDGEQKLSFKVSMLAPTPSQELLEALEEAKEIKNSKLEVKGYRNMKDLKEALEK